MSQNGCTITVTAKKGGGIELSSPSFNFADCQTITWVPGDDATRLQGLAVRPSETAVLPSLGRVKIDASQIKVDVSSLSSPQWQTWRYLLKVNDDWYEAITSDIAFEEEEPELINGTPQ